MTTEIEKMYENAGVEKAPDINNCYPDMMKCYHCEHYKVIDEYTGRCLNEVYPEFTAEKQLELIKWLANKTIKIVRFNNCFYVGTKFKPCKEDGGCFAGCEEIEFIEAIAGLINNLWQNLTEEERKRIKDILK